MASLAALTVFAYLQKLEAERSRDDAIPCALATEWLLLQHRLNLKLFLGVEARKSAGSCHALNNLALALDSSPNLQTFLHARGASPT